MNLSDIFATPKVLFKIFGFIKISDLTITLLASNIFFILLFFFYGKVNLVTYIVNSIFNLVSNISDNSLNGRKTLDSLFVFIFIFIAFFNFIGCLSFFPVNSLIFVPTSLSLFLFFLSLFIGIYEKKIKVLTDLIPSSVPKAVGFILFPIELVSTISKPISLSFRLLLNIAIRHMVAHILQNVVKKFGLLGTVIGPFVLGLVNFIEIGAGILQAYVFVLFGSMMVGIFLNKEH